MLLRQLAFLNLIEVARPLSYNVNDFALPILKYRRHASILKVNGKC